MSKTIKLLLAFVLFGYVAIAQNEEDAKPELSITGSVDAYFRANLGSEATQVPATSFANSPGFSLGMVNLVLGMEGEKAGFVADFVFGPRGGDAVFGSASILDLNGDGVADFSAPNASTMVNQLYAYWNVNDKVTLTLGNFNTFLGYEVISPTANFNYSTSYMFSYGPFSHTGLKADIALSDDSNLMFSIMNPTDATEFNPIGSYTLGAQFGYKGVYFNMLYGDQDGKLDENSADGDTSAGTTFQADITAGFDLTDELYLGLNATYNATGAGETVSGAIINENTGDPSTFLGAAAYLQYAVTDAFAVGTRIEYFAETNYYLGTVALDNNGNGSVIDLTLTGQYKVGGLTVIPEFRLDSASENTFLNTSNNLSKNMSSFVLAAVYAF